MSVPIDQLKSALAPFGGTAFPILNFDPNQPGQSLETQRVLLEYGDLIHPPHAHDKRIPPLQGVLEVEGRPFIYILFEKHLENQNDIKRLCDVLACRGHVSYLAVVGLGKLIVYPCVFEESPKYRTEVEANDKNKFFIPDLTQRLVAPQWKPNLIDALSKSEERYIRGLLKNRINRTIEAVVNHSYVAGLSGKSAGIDLAVALVGRAIFIRFLLDRSILTPTNARNLYGVSKNDFRNCFTGLHETAHTCAWLDFVFNGEMLPLPGVEPQKRYIDWVNQYTDFFSNVGDELHALLAPLRDLVCLVEPGGQMTLWDLVNFYHVPVGLLSEVYEAVAWKFLSKEAKANSQYYTPAHIARYMVDQAFDSISCLKRPTAKILDPTAGAGIFLVLCLRRLVAENWVSTGTRPDSSAIRKILYNQIFGFEINEHAINMSILSLYLMAIELDPEPQSPPIRKLRFNKPLKNRILFNVRDSHFYKKKNETEGKEYILGCIGDKVPKKFNNQMDLVIGNPPWSRQQGNEPLNQKANQIANRIISKNHLDNKDSLDLAGYSNPDFNPDLPVLWRSLDWAKENGTIAFAIHARHLFKQSKIAVRARNHLFSSMQVTGIVNGTDLRKTPVWPEISAPFCILFAKNITPSTSDTFTFVSPYIEYDLNHDGRFRIDPKRAHCISHKELISSPWLLKSLFRGTSLDIQLITKISSSRNLTSLDTYLKSKSIPFFSSGYKLGKPNKRSQSTEHILAKEAKKYDRTDHQATNILIQPEKLDYFQEHYAERPRMNPEIYAPPLLLVGEARTVGGHDYALSFDESYIAYSRNFCAISLSSFSGPLELKCKLLTFLYVMLRSSLSLYLLLLQSPKFGFERETIHLNDLKKLPIIPYDKLDNECTDELNSIFSNFIMHDIIPPQSVLDSFTAKVYGLDNHELQIIKDTLESNLPFSQNIDLAQSRPSRTMVNNFCSTLQRSINDLTSHTTETLQVVTPPLDSNHLNQAWIFVELQKKPNSLSSRTSDALNSIIKELASAYGASMLLFQINPDVIMLGLLAQRRYWTQSYATLCTFDVIQMLGGCISETSLTTR